MGELLEFRDIEFAYIGEGVGIGCIRLDELEVLLSLSDLHIKQEEDEE